MTGKNVTKSYWVSESFVRRFNELQQRLRDEEGLDYTQSEMLDEMLDLYEQRVFSKKNIFRELMKETMASLSIELESSIAKMLNAEIAEIRKLKG